MWEKITVKEQMVYYSNTLTQTDDSRNISLNIQ